MEDFFQNKILILVSTAIVGLVMGFLVFKPLFRYCGRRFSKRDANLKLLFKKLSKLSAPLGLVIFLNIASSVHILRLDASLIDHLVQVISILGLTYIICEVLLYIYDLYLRSTSGKVTSIFHILIKLVTYAIGFYLILVALHVKVTPILTALGVGGLAVALALQDTLTNLFSGIQILAARQVKPGDYIKLDSGEEGYVLDINWRNTEIQTLMGNFVIIPNSKISSSTTSNYFASQQRLFLHVIVGVHYKSDLDHVERVTLEVANDLIESSTTMPKFLTPRVRYFDFAESSINMRVWLPSDSYEHQHMIRHQFIKNLHKKFKTEGIEIPFPIRTVVHENLPKI